jgi:lipoprotein-anchoring transpeptidase ErfK/SrfK
MKAEGNARADLRILACVLLLVFSVASVWAIVSDYASLAVVAKGVTLVGHDVSGMDRAQVRAVIDQDVSTPLMQSLTAKSESASWVLNPQGIVSIDADSMIDRAYEPQLSATIAERLVDRLTGKPFVEDVKPAASVATSTLAGWVAQTATAIDRKPVDATRTVVAYALQVKPAVYGATLDQTRAVDQLAQVLTDEASLSPASRVVSLPVDFVAPKVLESSFKMAIVVSIRQCRVRLYDGTKLVKTYACAPGQPAWPTPTGNFVIATKQADAPWHNPHDAWSAGMPDVIPGGPGNPMGDRKIGINYPGVFLHGIPPGEYHTIGTRASHGCMRMMPSAVHDLYGRVKVGDPVFIRE